MRGTVLASLAAVLALAVQPAGAVTIRDHRSPSTGGGAYSFPADGVFEMTLFRQGGQSTTCETRNPTGRTDPVLHVLSFPMADGNVTELARDDDGGGSPNARVTFKAPTTGRYLLVLRSAGPGVNGSADLFCDGRQVLLKVGVGGAFKRLQNLDARESLRTVTGPFGSRLNTLYLLDDNGKMLSRYVAGPADSAFMAGGATGLRIAMVAGRWPDPVGELRLIRNDNRISGHDPDGDGLGSQLEAAIGTCSNLRQIAGGFDCSRAADARDTDGDGLRDDLELIGKLDVEPYQQLPRWGADPRHKDLFVEVDFGLQARTEATQKMSAGSANRFMALFGDPEPDPILRLLHAQLLVNPDGQPGVNTHLDTGLEMPPPSTGTGGGGRPGGGGTGIPGGGGIGGLGVGVGAGAGSTRSVMGAAGLASAVAAATRPASIAGAPAPGLAAGPVLQPTTPSTAVLTAYGNWGGFSVVQPVCNGAGCSRAKAVNVWRQMMDPARRGIFHYALGDPGTGGQAGPGISLNMPMGNGDSAAHEFGHTLGLNHEGQPPGVNCTPVYPSLMNYGYLAAFGFRGSFSDGFGRPALSDVAMREKAAVPAPTSAAGKAYLAHLRDVFSYNVDMATGDVDWNRDGVISTGTVKAYANFQPNSSGGCEITRDSQLQAQGLSDVAPALARMSGRVQLIYINEGDRRLRLETASTDLNCPAIGSSCGTLTPHPINETWNTGILSVDAVGGGSSVLVVFRTAQGLFETTLSSSFTWSAPRQIAISSPAISEISLTGKGGRFWLAYRDVSGAVFIKIRTGGAWGADQRAADAFSVPVALGPGAAPGILLATYKDGREMLLGAFPTMPDGRLALYQRAPNGGAWSLFPQQPTGNKVFGRPALALEPVDPASPLPGKLHLLYIKQTGTPETIVMQADLAATGIGPAAGARFFTTQHDNVWYYGNGADLLFEAGVDSNLRAAVSSALIPDSGPAPHFVQLRPKADGVVDVLQRNFNDWAMIGWSLCDLLRRNGASVKCPSKP